MIKPNKRSPIGAPRFAVAVVVYSCGGVAELPLGEVLAPVPALPAVGGGVVVVSGEVVGVFGAVVGEFGVTSGDVPG